MRNAKMSDLTGKILVRIVVAEDKSNIVFSTVDGPRYKMYHQQDCCEDVSIEDIVGELDDLIGLPILEARESTNEGDTGGGTFTWTFYVLRTNRGSVTIRWYGESNGYYSEDVTLLEI